MSRRPLLDDVRETTPDERASEALRDCAWVATCKDGKRFGGDTKEEAEMLYEDYYSGHLGSKSRVTRK